MPITSPPLTRPRLARANHAPNRGTAAAAGQLQLQLQLLLQVMQATDTMAAARAVTRCLPAQLRHCHAAVGLAGRDGTCRLLAVTGRERLDHRSERVRAIEAALDESIMASGRIAYTRREVEDLPAKTCEHLVHHTGSHWVISHPLRDSSGLVVGAWLMWGSADDSKAAATAWLSGTAQQVGTALKIASKAHQGILVRSAENLSNALRPIRRQRLWMIGILALAVLLVLPIPYQIRCGCVIEPVTRRYIAAPFDATLAQTLVKPGDVVTAGQLLVELDGREILWELASLQADYETAQKGRDTALADRKTLAAQLARLEMRQLEHQIALLKNRQENLQINSPVNGVVISGDLQRVEGAPVTTGQTLLEVAPMDKVIVEVAVEESNIAYLCDAAATSVRLDAFPGRSWQAAITTIHPRAEIRDAQQVFVAEAELVNHDGSLRPGMQGRAKVNGGRAPIGWILLHRPFHALTRWLGW